LENMPDAIAARYAEHIRGSAAHVYKKKPKGAPFDFEDLHSEAWNIALERWPSWANEGHCRADLKIHLSRWIRTYLYSKGWRQQVVKDGRAWKRGFIEEAAGGMGDLADMRQYVPEPEVEQRLTLAIGWPSMTRGQARTYARVLRLKHPVLAAEFLELHDRQRPRNLPTGQWEARKTSLHARLWRKWANELVEVMTEVVYGHESLGDQRHLRGVA